MGSGKTRVGRILSRRTGWPLVDTDDGIVRRAGKSVDRIFQEDGETAFREMEREVVSDLCEGSGQIIATGGGAFVSPENQRRLLEAGRVFCLSASPETILSRVKARRQPGNVRRRKWYRGRQVAVRPLLVGENPLERIEALLAQRAEAYAQAHHTIETDGLGPEQVAASISELCRRAWDPPS